MDARQGQPRLVLSLLVACALASCTGCNPLGWGISQVKSLIHHHAQRPVLPAGETWPAAERERLAPSETLARAA